MAGNADLPFYVCIILSQYNTHICTCVYIACCMMLDLQTQVHISIVGDDSQALIWDIQQMPRAIEDPILAYTAAGEINCVQWSATQPDWIAICYNQSLEILRV